MAPARFCLRLALAMLAVVCAAGCLDLDDYRMPIDAGADAADGGAGD